MILDDVSPSEAVTMEEHYSKGNHPAERSTYLLGTFLTCAPPLSIKSSNN